MEDLEGLDFNINISNNANANTSDEVTIGGKSGDWDSPDSWATETNQTNGKTKNQIFD